jgi:hypothetical protein
MTPKAPALVKIDKVEIKDPDNVTNIVTNIEPLVGAKYQFMRAYVKSPVSVVGKHALNTKLFYETYTPTSSKITAISTGLNSMSGDRNWKVVKYDSKSGKMKVTNPAAKYRSSLRSQPLNDANISLNVSTYNIPEKNKITMGIDNDFKYITDTIYTNVSFIPDSVNWAGEGKTGMVVDTDVSRSTFKKMGW